MNWTRIRCYCGEPNDLPASPAKVGGWFEVVLAEMNRWSVSVLRKATSAFLSVALSARPAAGCFARFGSSVAFRLIPVL